MQYLECHQLMGCIMNEYFLWNATMAMFLLHLQLFLLIVLILNPLQCVFTDETSTESSNLTNGSVLSNEESRQDPDKAASNATSSWRPWCLDAKYFGGRNPQAFGKLDYGNTSCVTFQDAIEIISTVGFGKSPDEKCAILASHTCDVRKHLECQAFDRLLPEIGRVVQYRCGCIPAIGALSFYRQDGRCYIPYGANYQCNPDANVSKRELICQEGFVCATFGRGVYRCRCPVGSKYDDDAGGHGGCVTDPEDFIPWIGLACCLLAIWGGVAMFGAIREDSSRLKGFRPKPVPLPEPFEDTEGNQIEDALMIVTPVLDDFEKVE